MAAVEASAMNKPSDESLMKEICRLEGLKNQLSSFNTTPAYAINKAKKGPGRPPKSTHLKIWTHQRKSL